MKNDTPIKSIAEIYLNFKNTNLHGRYITAIHIQPEIKKLPAKFNVEEIGSSVLKTSIKSVTFGNGPTKVLAWSQMHGNESTTTKAVFDLFNLFGSAKAPEEVRKILAACTIKIIPMLNPDGAARYTRENVNSVDLNRDAQDLKEPESQVLRECFNKFKPHFCLNLHDQRTIFSAGNAKKAATLSFLAPALDEQRNIPDSRKLAMQLIVAINADLQKFLPGQIGRYDDAFNLNCTGDTFQALKVPTILFEAGHFKNDYLREKSRKFMFLSIFSVLSNISNNNHLQFEVEDYFKIPENEKKFYDVILRNAKVKEEIVDVAIQFEEKVKSGKISFTPIVRSILQQLPFYGHHEIDCKNTKVSKISGAEIIENDIVEQILLNHRKLTVKI